MKNLTEHIGQLEIVKRENNSANGNPRYFIRVGNVYCYTRVDSMHNYGITNFTGKTVKASIGIHYGKNTLNTIVVA